MHALNRLTFGPRPGDVAAVEATGLDKWIDEQLNPQSIDDSALEQRLMAYPAMRLSLHERMRRHVRQRAGRSTARVWPARSSIVARSYSSVG